MNYLKIQAHLHTDPEVQKKVAKQKKRWKYWNLPKSSYFCGYFPNVIFPFKSRIFAFCSTSQPEEVLWLAPFWKIFVSTKCTWLLGNKPRSVFGWFLFLWGLRLRLAERSLQRGEPTETDAGAEKLSRLKEDGCRHILAAGNREMWHFRSLLKLFGASRGKTKELHMLTLGGRTGNCLFGGA